MNFNAVSNPTLHRSLVERGELESTLAILEGKRYQVLKVEDCSNEKYVSIIYRKYVTFSLSQSWG